MNVLMLTLMYPNDQLEEVAANTKDKLQNQINNYQRAFVEGIRANLKSDEKLDIINCIPVGIFPLQYRKLVLRSGIYDNGTIQQLGCINLPIFKQKCRSVSAKKTIEKWIKKNPNNRTVLVYTQYLPYMTALAKLKRRYSDLKVTVIITDLPNEMGLSSGRKGLMKKAEYMLGAKSLELLRKMDGYILLTEPMAQALQIQNKPYKVIEGLILSNEVEQLETSSLPAKPYFLYTGTLERELGILELLRAFELMPEYELWICGHGGMVDAIKAYGQKCPNIKFWGFVAQKEALTMQANATALLNPRQPTGIFTRYSFPSKTLEYMRSGKPVLCCKLEGIPSDYDQYLQYMPEGAEGIVQSVHDLMKLSDVQRKQIGEKGRNYVLQHKNPQGQCEKLIALLRSLS